MKRFLTRCSIYFCVWWKITPLIPSSLAAIFLACGTLCTHVHTIYAQVEHVPVVHPVYQVLVRWEAQRILPKDFSSSVLPLQRKEIIAALRSARLHDSLLNENDKLTLALFEHEFRITSTAVARQQRSAVFASYTDSTQVLLSRLLSRDEKSLFVIADSLLTVNVVPLSSVEARTLRTTNDNGATDSQTSIIGVLGGRIFGTIDNSVGYFLQGTNGGLLSGTRDLLLADRTLGQNATLRFYNGRFFDFAESHVRFEKDWFYAIVGRETRLIGAGYNSRLVYSDNAPQADAVTLGARFSGFEYRYTHFGLLGLPEPDARSVGAETFIPSKYMSYQRLAFRWFWGELGISESVIYSRRGLDMTYLVPVTLLRATSNALRDRDNYQLMFDVTLRPLAGIQFRGQHVLDDLTIPEIGRGWWANKAAWNAGIMAAPCGIPLDATLEYTRVEPYTFSHFDSQNAAVNDGFLFAGHLPPNADELFAQVRFWYGNRYPLSLTALWRRHGANEMLGDSLVRNVGGDVFRTVRYRFDTQLGQKIALDSERVVFLDGVRQDFFSLTLAAGWEITRQFNLQARYSLLLPAHAAQTAGQRIGHSFFITLRFEDF